MNIKVWPKNDQARKLLKHPTGVGFRETGPATWPDDSYTFRRLRDGDVVLNDPTLHSSPQHQPPPKTNPGA